MSVRSAKSGNSHVANTVRYVLAEHKIHRIDWDKPFMRIYVPDVKSTEKGLGIDWGNPFIGLSVPGVKFTEKDIHHMGAEYVDSQLLKVFTSLKGNVAEFMRYIYGNDYQKDSDVKVGVTPMVIKQGLRSNDIDGLIQEFVENEKSRIHVRANNVQLQHHVMSFSPEDSKYLTTAILRDLTEKFNALFAQNSLTISALHFEEHLHVHIIQSTVDICTGRSNRISRDQYAQLKKELQQYQMEKYPFLNSVVDHDKSKKRAMGINPSKPPIKSNERLYEKDKVRRVVTAAYSKSGSIEQFTASIKQQGYDVYYRADRLQGIYSENGAQLKYRFSRMGITNEMLTELDMKRDKEEKLLRDLKELRAEKTNDKTKSRLEAFNELSVEMQNEATGIEKDVSETTSPRESTEYELEDLDSIVEEISCEMKPDNKDNSVEQEM